MIMTKTEIEQLIDKKVDEKLTALGQQILSDNRFKKNIMDYKFSLDFFVKKILLKKNNNELTNS